MKWTKATVTGISIIALATSSARADAQQPGQVDFGSFTRAPGCDFIEVNVPPSLIALAAKFVEREEPEVAKLLNGLKLVRVNVVGLNEGNKQSVEDRVEKIRTTLAGSGWERLVTAQAHGQDVGVHMKMDEKSAVQGVAVTVLEQGKQAVFINVVGDIKPEQLTTLGERFNIDPLKELPPVKNRATGERAASEQ